MHSIATHVRRHLGAYLGLAALFVALGGTSYAAFSLPAGSVGSTQLKARGKNAIGGYVLAWAHVRSDGRLSSGSPGAVATYLNELAGQSPAGDNYIVGWRGVKVPSRCAAMLTVDDNGPLGSRGASAEADIYPKRSFVRPGIKTQGQARVDIANPADENVPDNFYVAVVC